MRRQRAAQTRHFCPSSYFHPSETELYYLQSRYYDPTTCRFLNADAYASTGQGILGHNMFAYCNNSPTSRMDISGTWGASVANVDDYDPIIDWAPPTGVGSGTSTTVGCVLVAGVGTVGAMGLNEFLKLLVGPVDLDFIPIDSISAMSLLAEAAEKEAENKEDTLPQQGMVEGNPEAPPVDAGKQGKHVPGHNNYDPNKSAWPDGKTGVQQTQEAWINGTADPHVPSGNVKIGRASDGTVVRVHKDGNGAIHGYPYDHPVPWLP